MTALRISVLGSGSVGLAIAATWARVGQQVTLLARCAAVPVPRQFGITVSGVSGDYQIEPQRLKVSDVANPNPEDVACDILVVATKAYQVHDALKRLLQRAGPAVAPRSAATGGR